MARMRSKHSAAKGERPRPGNGQNIWDSEQRLTLRLLFIDFAFSAQDAVKVFNRLYANHLRSCGVTNGLNSTALSSQYGERNRNRNTEQWQKICNEPTDSEESQRREVLRNRIQAIVASLNNDDGSQVATTKSQKPPSILTPPSTPAKRLRSISPARSIDIDKGEEIAQPATRKSKSSQSEAMVVISRVEQDIAMRDFADSGLITPFKTPNRSRSSSRPRPEATIRHELPNGFAMMLTPAKSKEREEAVLVAPTEDAAHPHVSLLFRYSTPTCQSPLTANGFLAGRFKTTIIPPPAPPPLEPTHSFPWSCTAQHLDRDTQIASPWISTSNNFSWIIRLAMREHKKGVQGGVISLIDPQLLQEGSLFHAQPLHNVLSKFYCFSKGAHLYHGMREFLIWGSIKREAIITTFPVEMLLNLAKRHEGIGALLRFEQMGQLRVDYHKKILPVFKQQMVQMNRETIVALAQVCKALTLKSTMVGAVSSIITDIVKEYGLVLESKTTEEWHVAASTFSKEMCLTLKSTTLADREDMKYAFLDGCRWAVGDFNARYKPKQMTTVLRKAEKLGLEAAIQMLVSELNNARNSIESYDTRQRTLLQGSASRSLLVEANNQTQPITPTVKQCCRRITDLSIGDDSGVDNTAEEMVEDRTFHDAEYDSDNSIYEI